MLNIHTFGWLVCYKCPYFWKVFVCYKYSYLWLVSVCYECLYFWLVSFKYPHFWLAFVCYECPYFWLVSVKCPYLLLVRVCFNVKYCSLCLLYLSKFILSAFSRCPSLWWRSRLERWPCMQKVGCLNPSRNRPKS